MLNVYFMHYTDFGIYGLSIAHSFTFFFLIIVRLYILQPTSKIEHRVVSSSALSWTHGAVSLFSKSPSWAS
jgi:hypothetical protein